MSRPRARRLPVEERSELVLDAALKLLQSHDAGSLTMDAVAERAGVAKPSVYNCFATKSVLLAALSDREERLIRALVKDALRREDVPFEPEPLLAAGLGAILHSVRGRPEGWRLIYPLAAAREPALAARVLAVRAANLALTQRACESWLHQRGHPDVEALAALISRLIAGALDQLIELLLNEPDLAPDEVAAQSARALSAGILALLAPADPKARPVEPTTGGEHLLPGT